MSADTALRNRVEDLLFREAALLDEKKWQAWLQLYVEDAVFWMPACSARASTLATAISTSEARPNTSTAEIGARKAPMRMLSRRRTAARCLAGGRGDGCRSLNAP